MVDLIYSYHVNNKKPSKKRSNKASMVSNVGGRNRLKSAPSIKNPITDPQVKMYGTLNFDHDYLSAEPIINLKSGENLGVLISSFFNLDIRKKTSAYNLDEWEDILEGVHEVHKISLNQQKLYSSLNQGLPPQIRREIWLYLAQVEQLKKQHSKEQVVFDALANQECPQEEKIRNDVKRSFSNHPFLKINREAKIQSMHRVLRAYANFDPEVGYTQGMNFVVGMLLYMNFSEIETNGISEKIEEEKKQEEINISCVEEDVFWILVYIMQKKDWRNLYVSNTPKLQDLLQKFDEQMQKSLPRVHEVITEHSCLPGCFSQYFLTILLYNPSLEIAKRTFELFLVTGEEILYHLLIKVLTIREQEILEDPDMEFLFGFLRNKLFVFCDEQQNPEDGI